MLNTPPRVRDCSVNPFPPSPRSGEKIAAKSPGRIHERKQRPTKNENKKGDHRHLINCLNFLKNTILHFNRDFLFFSFLLPLRARFRRLFGLLFFRNSTCYPILLLL